MDHVRTAGPATPRRHPGTALHELIREEFGDGIMSAIDFSLDFERVPDPKGDRVQLTWNGKFLPCRAW